MNKVLIIGGSGLLEKSIIREMKKYKEFQVYSTYYENPLPLNQCRSFKLNVHDSDNIYRILNTLKPQIIISCLRGDFAKQLILHTKIAEYLKKINGYLYLFSTTNVFDSDYSKPHYEDDFPSSCAEHGQYKITCEKKITEILQDNACILRIPQVLGKHSPRMSQLL